MFNKKKHREQCLKLVRSGNKVIFLKAAFTSTAHCVWKCEWGRWRISYERLIASPCNEHPPWKMCFHMSTGRCIVLHGAVHLDSSYLVDPASSHMLVSKIKPCMSKYKQVCTVKLRMAH